MSCKICGRGACASWMHSAEEQAEFDSVDGMDEQQLRREVVDLRREVASLKAELETANDKLTGQQKPGEKELLWTGNR